MVDLQGTLNEAQTFHDEVQHSRFELSLEKSTAKGLDGLVAKSAKLMHARPRNIPTIVSWGLEHSARVHACTGSSHHFKNPAAAAHGLRFGFGWLFTLFACLCFGLLLSVGCGGESLARDLLSDTENKHQNF